MKKIVYENLYEFLKEWVDPAEDKWANREIDLYQKRKSGIIPEENPQDILEYPEDIPIPKDTRTAIKNIIDYFKDKDDISAEDFKNLCIWVSRVYNDFDSAIKTLEIIIAFIPSIIKEIKTAKYGGKYREGLEYILNKFKRGDGEDS